MATCARGAAEAFGAGASSFAEPSASRFSATTVLAGTLPLQTFNGFRIQPLRQPYARQIPGHILIL